VLALKSLFGEVGGAAPIEVLSVDPEKCVILLRCPDHAAPKVRSAITLQSVFLGEPVAYHVKAEGSSLLSLAKEIE